MANGSKVFVSPGVYTSEKDLSFVAQSVGVTTLGLVGEALKGPAFEPIFISSYDDYVTRFGGTSPQTYVDSQIPKYEMGYISKSYLSQANQLFVTRVLGLSGYDLFHEFCEKAHNFDRGWVKSTWKGCRPDKGLGYLYWLVKNQ